MPVTNASLKARGRGQGEPFKVKTGKACQPYLLNVGDVVLLEGEPWVVTCKARRCLCEFESNTTWRQMDAKHYGLFHPDRSVHQFAPRGQFKTVAVARTAQQRLPAALALEASARQLAARKAPGPCLKPRARARGLKSKAPLPRPSTFWPKCWRPRWTRPRKTWKRPSFSVKGACWATKAWDVSGSSRGHASDLHAGALLAHSRRCALI